MKQEVIFLMADTPNANNRIYPRDVCLAIVEQINKTAETGMYILGELQPEQPYQVWGAKDVVIDLGRISHTVESAKIEGDYVTAQVRFLNTPQGIIAQGLLAKNARLKFAPRGRGTVDSKTGIVSDYKITSVDIVDVDP